MMTLVATPLIPLGRKNSSQEERVFFIMGATADTSDLSDTSFYLTMWLKAPQEVEEEEEPTD